MPSDRLRASLLGWLLKVLAYGGSVFSASVLLWLIFRRDSQGKEGDDWYEIKPREEGDEPKDGVLDSAEEKIPLTDADGHKIPDGDADGPIGEPPDGDAKKPTEGDAGFPSNGKIPKQTTGSQTDLTLPTSDDADTEEDRPLLQAAGDRRPKRPKQSDETQTDFDDLDPNLSPSPLKDFKFVDDYSPKDESGLPGSRPDEPRPQSSDFYRVREGPAKYRPASYLIAVGAKDEDAVGPKEGQQPDQGDAVDGRVPSDDAGNGQTSPTRMGGAVPSVQSDDSGVQLDDAGNLHPPGSTLRTITRETYEYRVSGVKRAAWFKGEAAPENGQGEAGKPPIDESGEGVGDTSGDESRPSLQKQTDGTQTDFDAVEPVSLSDESLLKSHDKVPSDPDKVHQYQGLAQKLTRAYLESEGRQQNDDTQGLSTSDESWYTPETEFYPSSGGEQGLPFYDASYTSPAKQSATPKRSPSSGEASLLEDDVSGGGKSLPEKGRSGMGKRKGQQADQVPSDGTSEPTGRHIPRDKLPAQKSSGGSQTDLNELELSRVAWGMQVDDDNRRDAKSDDDKETTATSGRGRPGVNENEQNKGQGRPNTNEDEQKKGQSRPGVNEGEQKKGQSRPGANEDEQKKGKADQYGKVKIDTSMKREYPDQDDIGGTEEPRPGEQITDEIYHPDVHEKGAPGKDDVEDGSRPTATKTGRGQRGDLDEYGKPLAGSGVRLVKQTTTVTVERKVQPSMLTQSSAQTDFDDKALEGYLGLRHGALKIAGPEEDGTGQGGEGERSGLPATRTKAGERLNIRDQSTPGEGRSGLDDIEGRSVLKHQLQGNDDLHDQAGTDQRKQQLDHRLYAEGRPGLQGSGQVRPSADEHLLPTSDKAAQYLGPVSEEGGLDTDRSDNMGGQLSKRLQRGMQGVDQYGEPTMDEGASEQGKLKQYGQSPSGDERPNRYGLIDKDISGVRVDQYGRPVADDVEDDDQRKYAQGEPSMYDKKGSRKLEDALRSPLGKDKSWKEQLEQPRGPLTSEQDVRQASGVITGRGLKQLAFDLHGRPIDELHPDYGRLPSDKNSKACQAGVSVTRLLRDHDYKVYGRPMGTDFLIDDGKIEGIAATVKQGASLMEADKSDATGAQGKSAESITSKEPSKEPSDADEVHPSKRPSILDELDSMMAKANAALSSAEKRLSELQTDEQEPSPDDSTEQQHPRDDECEFYKGKTPGDQDLSRPPNETTGAAGKGVPPRSTTKEKRFSGQQVEPLSEFAEGKEGRRQGETDSKGGARDIANADLASPIAGDIATDREPYTPSSPADVASSGAGESETDDSMIGTPPDAVGKDHDYRKGGDNARTPTSPLSSTNAGGEQIGTHGAMGAGPPYRSKHEYVGAISPKEESPNDKRTPSPGVVQVLDASLAASGDRTTERSDREVIRGDQAGEDEPLLEKKSSPKETSPADQVDAATTGASPLAGSPVDDAAQKAAEALTFKAAGGEAAKAVTDNEIENATRNAAKHRAEEEAAILAAKNTAEEEAADKIAKKTAEEDAVSKAPDEASKRITEKEPTKVTTKESDKEVARKAVEGGPPKTAEEDAAKKATEKATKRKAEDEADRLAAKTEAGEGTAGQDAEETAKRKSEEDAAKKKAEEEAARRKAGDEAATAAAKKRGDEAVRRDSEEAVKKKAEEDAARKTTEEAEKQRKADQHAASAAARKTEEDKSRQTAKEATKRTEEDAARKAAKDAANSKEEEEASMAAAKKAEEEAARKAAEDAAKKKAEEDVGRKAAEEAAKRKAEEEATTAAARGKEQEAARHAAEEAAKKKADEHTARKAAEEAAKRKAEGEAAMAAAKQKAEEQTARKAAEEAAKKKAEEDAAKTAAEEAAKRKAEEDAAMAAALKKEQEAEEKAAEEAAKKKAEEDAARKTDEEAAKRKAEEEASMAAARKKAEEETARKAAEEAAKKKAEEDAARKAAEEAAKRKAEEEAAMAVARKKAEEEAARKAAEEAAKKKAEEDAAKKATEEAEKRKAEEETATATARKKEEETAKKAAEEAAKKKAEEDAARKAAEEAAKRKAEEVTATAAARKKAEEEAARKAAEEAAKKKAEEDAARKAAEEAAKCKAEEEAATAVARKKAEEEAARKAAEEAAKKKAKEDAAKRAAEEAAKRKVEEDEAMTAAKKAEEEAARKAAEAAAKKKAEEDAAKKAAEEAAKRKAEEDEAMMAAKKAEEEAARKAAEEAAKKKAEEDAARKAAEEAAKRKAEEEAATAAARKKAEEETARKAAEEAAKKKAEEDAARKAAEEAAKRKAEEVTVSATARKKEEEASRKAAEDAAKKKAEEDAAKQAAEEAAKRKANEETAKVATKKAEKEAVREEAAKRKAEEDDGRKTAKKLDKEAESESKTRTEDEISRKSAEEDTQGRAPGAKVAAEEATKITPEEAAQKGAADEVAVKARAEEQAAAEKMAAEEEKAARLAAAEAAKKEAEESAKKKAAEELAAKISAEDTAQKPVEAEPAKLTGKAAKKAAKEAAKKKEAEEKAARKAAEEEAKKKAAEEKAAKKAAEAAAKKAAQEASKKKSDKERAAMKVEDDAARKAAEESARKGAEDLAAKRAAEEQAKAEEEAKKAAEEAAKKAEEEAAKKAAEEAAKKKADEEAAQKAAEEAAKKKAEKQKEAEKRATEDAARKKAEEEAARRAEQEAAEEAAKKAPDTVKEQETEPSAKKALEELVAKKTAEEEKAADANGVPDEVASQNPLQAEEKELKSFYREAGNNVQPIPWMEDFKVDLDDVNMDLSIENQPRISALRTPRQQKRVSGTEGRPRTPDAGKTIHIDEIFDPLTNIRGKKGEPPKRILIRGQPGIGKSTLCRKLAYDWSNPENETGTIKKFKYTFLIEGRHLGGDLKNAMAEQLLSQGFNDTPENLWKFVEDNQNDVLFIVDGYDEIDSSVKSDVGDLISKKILPQSTLVLTSRPESTKEISRSVDKQLKVEGFNQEKSADFVNKHFHVTSPNTEHAPDVTENLVAALRRDKNLQQLAAYPLCNAYLCALWEDTDGDVPTTKSSLYDRLKIVVTRRYCLKQGVPLPAKSSDVPVQFRSHYRALGELAYNGVTNNKVLFDKPLVLHKVRDPRVLQMGLLLEEHSIARTKRHEYYRFPHKAFQEFFAAQHLSEMSAYVRSPTYPKLVKDRVWRDIVLFLPGALKQQPRDLIPLFKALSEYNTTRKSTYSDVGQYRLSLDTLFEAELQDQYSTIVAPSLPSLLTESHPIIEGVSSPTLQGLACVLKQNNIDVKEFRFGVWTEKYDQNCDTLTEALNDNQTVGKLVIAACNENDVVESVKDILARLAERNNTVKSLQIIDYSYKGPLKYDERIEMLRKVCTIEEIKIDSAARVWYPGLPQNPSEAQHTIRSTPMTPMSTD
ncbi:microtubule-associated protein futsch-like isoform X4 [Branchiostoma lanceolatum]|uniref:microtubule-associated protein futsch-like isoform X4 n=1 Tax=Branchiostoma lanceolatum TaxID=7740 RepID=UPI003455B6E2